MLATRLWTPKFGDLTYFRVGLLGLLLIHLSLPFLCWPTEDYRSFFRGESLDDVRFKLVLFMGELRRVMALEPLCI